MKKLLIVSSAIGLFFATSCKKDYSCDCSWKDGDITLSQTETIQDVTKSEAEDACKGLVDALKENYSCELR